MSDILQQLSAALAGRYVLERELGRGGMAAVLRGALARNPGSNPVGINLFNLYLTSGRLDEGLAWLVSRHDTSTMRRALLRGRNHPGPPTRQFDAAEPTGDRLAGRRRISIPDYATAPPLFAGNNEQALTELERAEADRDPRLELIKVDPTWAPLRADPRFTAIVARMGLPP